MCYFLRSFLGGLVVMLLSESGPALIAATPGAAQVLEVASIKSGLVVHLGHTDGTFEADLAGSGNILAQALVQDPTNVAAARAAIAAKGLHGLATIDCVKDYQSLPYAGNLVNVLVADLDELGAKAPAQAEILRVLAAGTGVAYLKKADVWTSLVKPRPKGMDDWTHFDHGPDGNGVSCDQLVDEPTRVQWISGIQPVITGDNPAKYKPSTGYRIAGGKAYYTWATGQAKVAKTIDYFLTARDAFNGLPLWNVRTKIGCMEWGLVAEAGRVYTFLEQRAYPVVIDGDTGKTLLSFENGLRMTNLDLTTLRVAGATLVETANDTMVALDTFTGSLKWKYKSKDGNLFYTTVAAEANRVFAVVAPKTGYSFARWPSTKATKVICLDLASGKLLWASPAGDKKIGQAIYQDGKLALFGPAGIGALDSQPVYTGCLDASDGRLLWEQSYPGGGQYNQTWGLNALVNNGAIYYATPWNLFRCELQSGERTLFWGSGYNQRCNRFAGTEKLFVMGLGTWINATNGQAKVYSVSRSGCAQGVTLANGLAYYTPNVCGCIAQVRGHLAVSSEAIKPALADAARLDREGASVLSSRLQRVALETPLTREWKYFFAQERLETEPVAADGKSLAAIMHEDAVQCRAADGTVLWTTLLGGRVTSPPVVSGQLAYVGAHDGCVYALDIVTGRLQWRFRAAPCDLRIVTYGRVSSAWPVLGVVLHEGKLCASAGFHPETGGIHVWGLEPATGAIAWHKPLQRQAIATNAGQVKTKITANRVINDVLKSDGQNLGLPGITFTPSDSDEELQAKLMAPGK